MNKKNDLFRDNFSCTEIPPLTSLVAASGTSEHFNRWMTASSHAVFEPSCRVLENAYVLPNSFLSPRPLHAKHCEHVVYTSDLEPVTIAGHYKYGYEGFVDNECLGQVHSTDIAYEAHDAYYMGGLFIHYGHFILESLTRYWYALSNDIGDVKFVFNVWKANAGESEALKARLFHGRWGDFFNGLGITKENIILLERPMQFKTLIVPQCAYSISPSDCFVSHASRLAWLHINKRMSQIYAMQSSVKTYSENIYISRRAVKNPAQGRRIMNESEVEAMFVSLGFSVVVPEELESQFEMQSILSKAKVIASSPGSGLQNAVFIPQAANVLIICCENMNRENRALLHQLSLNYICKHKTHVYYQNDLSETGDQSSAVDIPSLKDFTVSLISSDAYS